MKDVHIAIGGSAITLNAAAGLWGGWLWWRVGSSAWFWRLLRGAQAVVVLEVALGGVLVVLGHRPKSLHLIYGLLPILITLLAEQLRIASAEMVLGAHGYASAAEVGTRPDDEQRALVRLIVQREIGVMALAALVIVVLLARAAGTA